GIILAGGQATRMGGGDKCLLPLGGTPLLSRIIERLAPQVDTIALNANGDAARFAEYDVAVVADSIAGFAGPLAGVLSGLDHAATTGHSHVVSIAGDTPFFPCDLVPHLQLAGGNVGLALAASPSGRQPTFGIWPVALREDLRDALHAGTRKVVQWTEVHNAGTATFPEDAAFFNVNTPADLAAAEAML
ncbi:MAG: molybdenum cofactor guanylyltransferase MobA, partial [Pseudomonadota bacterium]